MALEDDLELAREIIRMDQEGRLPETDNIKKWFLKDISRRCHPDKISADATPEQKELLADAFVIAKDIYENYQARLEKQKEFNKARNLKGLAKDAYDLIDEEWKNLQNIWADMNSSKDDQIRALQALIPAMQKQLRECQANIVRDPSEENIKKQFDKLRTDLEHDLKETPANLQKLKGFAKVKSSIRDFFKRVEITLAKIFAPSKVQEKQQSYDQSKKLKSSQSVISSMYNKAKNRGEKRKASAEEATQPKKKPKKSKK